MQDNKEKERSMDEVQIIRKYKNIPRGTVYIDSDGRHFEHLL